MTHEARRDPCTGGARAGPSDEGAGMTRIETAEPESRSHDGGNAEKPPARGAARARAWARTRRRVSGGGRAPGARVVLAFLSLTILVVGVPIVTVMRSYEHVLARRGSRAA